MNQITVTGLVLTAMPIGEYDKRIVILTKERGRIAACAKGARKPGSPLSGAVMPFAFGQFTVYEGRTSYTLSAASISNYFAELREDVEAAYYGFYFMDVANYYAREANDERELLKLLYQSLRALAKKSIQYQLIRYIFELKVISINGEAPQVFQCVVCGAADRQTAFSIKRGGLVCSQCGHSSSDMVLDPSTVYAMQYIISSTIEKLYTFTVSKKVLKELGAVIPKYMEAYVDKHFKSLDILNQLTEIT